MIYWLKHVRWYVRGCFRIMIQRYWHWVLLNRLGQSIVWWLGIVIWRRWLDIVRRIFSVWMWGVVWKRLFIIRIVGWLISKTCRLMEVSNWTNLCRESIVQSVKCQWKRIVIRFQNNLLSWQRANRMWQMELVLTSRVWIYHRLTC